MDPIETGSSKTSTSLEECFRLKEHLVMDSPAEIIEVRRKGKIRGGLVGGGMRGEEEGEEEQHHNPFISSAINNPSSSKLQFRKEASRARWDEELGMGEVVDKKGSMWATTGIVRNGKLYCHIEEIMFLAERGALLISDCDGTTFTLKDLYQKVVERKDEFSWESFEAYRHLKSLGYIVGRHGIPWIVKSNTSCLDCISLQSTSNGDGRSTREKVTIPIIQRLKDMQLNEMKPTFDVFLPNSKYRKSSPGYPSFLLCVLGEIPPSRIQIEDLEKQCNGIPLKYCHADHGRVSFFSFDKVVLPVLP